MPDLKTHLSALMIEFRYTRSRKVIHEMADLIVRLENAGDFQIAQEFLSGQPERYVLKGFVQKTYGTLGLMQIDFFDLCN